MFFSMAHLSVLLMLGIVLNYVAYSGYCNFFFFFFFFLNKINFHLLTRILKFMLACLPHFSCALQIGMRILRGEGVVLPCGGVGG